MGRGIAASAVCDDAIGSAGFGGSIAGDVLRESAGAAVGETGPGPGRSPRASSGGLGGKAVAETEAVVVVFA